jgi:hypothetical protein
MVHNYRSALVDKSKEEDISQPRALYCRTDVTESVSKVVTETLRSVLTR